LTGRDLLVAGTVDGIESEVAANVEMGRPSMARFMISAPIIAPGESARVLLRRFFGGVVVSGGLPIVFLVGGRAGRVASGAAEHLAALPAFRDARPSKGGTPDGTND
jgi:hypothetical protein